MSESYPSQPEKEVVRSCARIGEKALRVIDGKYGRGYPDLTKVGGKRPYHNGFHGRNVGADSKRMAQRLGFSKAEIAVLEAAGNAHDLVFTGSRGSDERKSADWLAEQMEKAGVDLDLKNMGRYAILATEPRMSGNKVVGQMADRLHYPSKKIELGAKAVACADFGGLYAPHGPLDGHQWFREDNKVPYNAEFPLPKLVTFQENQLGLLENYRYPLREANSVLATHRGPVTKYAENVLEQLKNGNITSMGQLLEQDVKFLRGHS